MKREPPRLTPGQESVWDYPRPPRLEDSVKHVRVVFNAVVIADTRLAKRVLETSHPPVYYIPIEDIQTANLLRTSRATFCEWKGSASYYTVAVNGREAQYAAWYYPEPSLEFASIKNHIAFYPSKMDACYLNGELVRSQPGDFYGGWITSEIIGPFKGDPGTSNW